MFLGEQYGYKFISICTGKCIRNDDCFRNMIDYVKGNHYKRMMEKELEKAKKEILEQVAFEKLEILKASFTTACNVGVGTLGLAFWENKK